MKKILCFGELLLRISPSSNEELAQNPMLVFVGGSEANAATALAGWNVPVKYCTVLPDNFMSKHVIHYLEYQGIYASSIVFSGNRMGIYYLERGADLKGSSIYDRENSSFSQVKRGTIEWAKILQDVSWFHFSAVNPSLNENVADVCLEALEVASAMGIQISIDLNYRSSLWKYGKQPIEVMPKLVEYADVIMGNIWSAKTMLGTGLDEHIYEKNTKEAYLEQAKATSAEIIEKFPKCKIVANTFRFDSDSNDILYYTSLFKDGNLYSSPDFTSHGVVDKSGSGDCFMAGLIYGITKELLPQELLDYATAAGFGKLQEVGDATSHDVLTVKRIRKEQS